MPIIRGDAAARVAARAIAPAAMPEALPPQPPGFTSELQSGAARVREIASAARELTQAVNEARPLIEMFMKMRQPPQPEPAAYQPDFRDHPRQVVARDLPPVTTPDAPQVAPSASVPAEAPPKEEVSAALREEVEHLAAKTPKETMLALLEFAPMGVPDDKFPRSRALADRLATPAVEWLNGQVTDEEARAVCLEILFTRPPAEVAIVRDFLRDEAKREASVKGAEGGLLDPLREEAARVRVAAAEADEGDGDGGDED